METNNRNWILVNLIIILNFVRWTFTQEFITQPSDTHVNVGDSVNLFCFVQQLQDGQTLGWIRDQERITRNSEFLVNLEHFTLRLDSFGYILKINSTKPSDANRYACAVYMDDESYPVLKSDYAQVEVWQKPDINYPQCSSTAVDYRFIQGSQVSLNCIAEYLTPRVQLQWLYNGNTVNFGTVNINNDLSHVQSKFSFEASRNYHLAEFTCTLTTEYDASILQSCTTGPLEIDYKPIVNIEPIIATAGEEISMFCNATGNPDPFIHIWHFYPDISQDLYAVDQTGMYLHLFSPRTRMNGTTIECVAYNTVGFGKDQSLLIVQGEDPPEDNIINIVTPIQSGKDDGQFTSMGTNTVAIIFLIVGIFSVIIVFFAVIPVCFRPACREVIDSSGHKIPQPDVYFEPKDRVLPPVPSEEQYASWRRSVAVQVSDTGGDLDSTYAEVMEEIEDKELSIIYSRKSIYI